VEYPEDCAAVPWKVITDTLRYRLRCVAFGHQWLIFRFAGSSSKPASLPHPEMSSVTSLLIWTLRPSLRREQCRLHRYIVICVFEDPLNWLGCDAKSASGGVI